MKYNKGKWINLWCFGRSLRDIQVKNPLAGVMLGVSRIDLSTEPKIWKYNSLVWYTLMSAYFRAHIFNFSYERFRPGRYIVNDTSF